MDPTINKLKKMNGNSPDYEQVAITCNLIIIDINSKVACR